MKVNFTIKIPENIEGLTDAAARVALIEVIQTIALPVAQEKAPGTIPSQIRVLPIVQTGTNTYRCGLAVPAKYMNVEKGTGVYAGGSGWEVLPRRAKALLFATGQYAKSAFVLGQRAQPFLRPAIKAARAEIGRRFASAFTRSVSGSNH